MVRRWRSGKIRALIDLRVAGSNPAGQLLILFPQCFSSSYKNSMSTCKSSSQVPHQSFRAQTAVLLTPAFGPPDGTSPIIKSGQKDTEASIPLVEFERSLINQLAIIRLKKITTL